MKGRFRQSMAWLHSWAGLVVGWILFFMFLTGTLGYLKDEIDYWMNPEIPYSAEYPSSEKMTLLALDRLTQQASGAEYWVIGLPGDRGSNTLSIGWVPSAEPTANPGAYQSEVLNHSTGQPVEYSVRETNGGRFLYQLHYRFHYFSYDWAIRIAGLCAMFMFVAIISGVIVHKKIFVEFFTFRPGRGQRSWLDAHNALSVSMLPFHLMITYSGLVFLMVSYVPSGPEILFGSQAEDRVYAAMEAPPPEPTQQGAISLPMTDVMRDVLGDAETYWGGAKVSEISIDHPGQSGALMTVYPHNSETLVRFGEYLHYDGLTGERLPSEQRTLPANINGVMLGLHEALFAGPILRVLFVLAGLSGTAMIGAGLVLWVRKRRLKVAKGLSGHFGIAIVERLNAGTIIGLPVAIAGYFWINRLLPVDLAARAEWEANGFFLLWGAFMVFPIWRPNQLVWRDMAVIGACLFGLVPVLNLLTSDRHLGASIPIGDWGMAGFDLCTALIGLAFAAYAVKVHRSNAAEPEQGRRVSLKERHARTVK